jgi:glucosylceramidase
LLDYYVYGQFMKFIQRGAVRVDSAQSSHGLATVAFVNPDGHIALVVANTGREEELLNLCYAGRTAPARLDGKSVATFIWAR